MVSFVLSNRGISGINTAVDHTEFSISVRFIGSNRVIGGGDGIINCNVLDFVLSINVINACFSGNDSVLSAVFGVQATNFGGYAVVSTVYSIIACVAGCGNAVVGFGNLAISICFVGGNRVIGSGILSVSVRFVSSDGLGVALN